MQCSLKLYVYRPSFHSAKNALDFAVCIGAMHLSEIGGHCSCLNYAIMICK